MYTPDELKEIRDALERKVNLSDEEIEKLRKNFGSGQAPHHLRPFITLSIKNPDLYSKISGDKKVEGYSYLGFFPETFDLCYNSDCQPLLSFGQGNRGLVTLVSHPTKKLVIKPLQSNSEYGIAQIAGKLGVGPKQFQTIEGFLTEEFVEGELFSRLNRESTPDQIYAIGRRVGEILSFLHAHDVYYNDTMLSDDLGRSHLIVPAKSPSILFDYGVALMLQHHPDLSDEEIFNFVRTLPLINMSIDHRSKSQMQQIAKEYRPLIAKATKEQILARDVNFINEGLTCAADRLSSKIIEPFAKGFNETYKN